MNYLTSRLGVSLFLVEQSDAFTPSAHFLRMAAGPKQQVAAVTHLPEDGDRKALADRYLPPFDQLFNFPPKARLPKAQNRETVEAMLRQAEYLICRLEPGSVLAATLGKTVRGQKHLKIFDLWRPSE